MLNLLFRHNVNTKLTPVRIKILREMNIPNMRLHSNGVISGPTFQDRPLSQFQILRKLGIKRIIDFRADAPDSFASTCKQNGFRYYKLPFDFVDDFKDKDFYISVKGQNKLQVSKKLMKLFRKFFKLMKKGDVYMGCQYGIDRTNKALTLNYFFNNKAADKNAPRLLHWPEENMKSVVNRNVRIARRVYEHLSERQKNKLGLPPSFVDILKEKMPKFMRINSH